MGRRVDGDLSMGSHLRKMSNGNMGVHYMILLTSVFIQNSSHKKKAYVDQVEFSHWIKNKFHTYVYWFSNVLYVVMIDKIQIHLKKKYCLAGHGGSGRRRIGGRWSKYKIPVIR